MIGDCAGVVGVDARQIELGEELVEFRALGGRFLERRNGDLVVAGLVGAEALLERCLRGSVLDAATGLDNERGRKINPCRCEPLVGARRPV